VTIWYARVEVDLQRWHPSIEDVLEEELGEYGACEDGAILGNAGPSLSLRFRVDAASTADARRAAEALVRGALANGPLSRDEGRLDSVSVEPWRPYHGPAG
jgi:hypothetical protein